MEDKTKPFTNESIQSMTDKLYSTQMHTTTSWEDIFFDSNRSSYNNGLLNTGLNMAEKAEIVEQTIMKMKLLNMLTSDKQVQWLEEHPEDYKYIVNPDNDVKNIKSFQKDL